MSTANIVLVKRFYEDRHQSDLRAFMLFVDDEAEFDYSELDRPYGRVFRGREQIEALYGETNAPWGKLEFEVKDLTADGDHLVLTIERTSEAPGGGPRYWGSLAAAITVRASRIVWLKLFADRREALSAVGLADS
jgi:ketosteroid isomerase-like protein